MSPLLTPKLEPSLCPSPQETFTKKLEDGWELGSVKYANSPVKEVPAVVSNVCGVAIKESGCMLTWPFNPSCSPSLSCMEIESK